jgi:hypothetical protein
VHTNAMITKAIQRLRKSEKGLCVIADVLASK